MFNPYNSPLTEQYLYSAGNICYNAQTGGVLLFRALSGRHEEVMDFKGLKLDRFQEEAISAIGDGKSVIVAAPTGAGKTVIAEYAIEKAIAAGKEIIYTAPIKALSNQKFRDFSRDYPDKIGIMTGDVIINPEAPVLIMTTEIFRNIIFDQSAERLQNVETVIFDEIHYINDIQRGTVWEESIIFAPQHINFICLSATIPNFREFTEWMQAVRERPIESIVETKRPVPLEVQIWVPGAGFRDMKFIRKIEKDKSQSKKRRASNVDLVHHLKRENQLPCLYFHFSRVGCEEYAQHFRSANLLKDFERRKVLDMYDRLCERFNVEMRGQALLMRKLLASGVAFHHAGVLPSLKEVIERLYTLGLIKLLFTTETFAVGINMPARSVIFHNLMKNDGISFRYLTAREFQQMSGRAGRRGIDEVGYAYACVQPRDASYEGVKQTLSRDAEDIESQFSLSYSSILNLYETYGDLIYEVCEKSFNNYKTVAQVNQLKSIIGNARKEIERLENDTKCLHGSFADHIYRFMDLRAQYSKLLRKINNKKKKKKSARFELKQRLQDVKQEMSKLECPECRKQKSCRNAYKKINRVKDRIKDYREEMIEVENSQRNILERRLGFLTDLGYMNEDGLMPRGKIAAQIFGYEIVFTELFFEGMFEGIDETTINVLVSSIVFESRRGISYRRKMPDAGIDAVIGRADETVEWLRKKEHRAGVPGLIKPLDPKLNRAVYEWSRGCSFQDLKTFTSAADGDLVRSFRLIVDFLRQLKRAIDEPGFREKMEKCVELIYRDVVDAEAQLKTELEERAANGSPGQA